MHIEGRNVSSSTPKKVWMFSCSRNHETRTSLRNACCRHSHSIQNGRPQGIQQVRLVLTSSSFTVVGFRLNVLSRFNETKFPLYIPLYTSANPPPWMAFLSWRVMPSRRRDPGSTFAFRERATRSRLRDNMRRVSDLHDSQFFADSRSCPNRDEKRQTLS